VATVSIVGPDAALKAERTAEALIARATRLFAARGWPGFAATHVEALGAEASYGENSRARATREVLLRLVVVHPSREALEIFARELGSVGLSCAPGTTGIFGGRPKPSPVVKLYTFFLDKKSLAAPLVQLGEDPAFAVNVPLDGGYAAPIANASEHADVLEEGPTEVLALGRLAYARSGDKGDSANVAIIARHPALMDVLRRQVTPARVVAQLGGLARGPATRYEAPGLFALNFLVEQALGGGGMASLRIDPQGKAYGQMVLEMPIEIPSALIPLLA
jgi:hypothetical protein